MQLSIWVAGQDVSNVALLEQTEILRDSTDAISTATVVFHADMSQGARWDFAYWDQFYWGFEPIEWQEIQLKDQAGTVQFAGFITRIEREAEAGGGQNTMLRCTCSDRGILLDRTTINTTWTNWSDADIITDAFASQTAVTINPAYIATIVGSLATFEAKDITLRELLERICDLTGGEWRVDYAGNLRYYSAGTAAPFAVSDAPNESTTFAHFISALDRDFTGAANRITLLGGFDVDGNEISAIAEHLESQSRYGILSATVVDRGIGDQATADLRAAAEIEQRAMPRVSGKLTVWRDGLDVGQSLSITNTAYGLSGAFLIRALKITQVNISVGGVDEAGQIYCIYEVEFGQRTPDLITRLRRLELEAQQPTYTPRAQIAGKITADNFATTIQPVHIVNAKPVGGEWTAYPDDAIFLLTTDRKLYRRTGNDWTAAVQTIDLTGQITETQITDDAISTPKLQAGSITALKLAANSVTAGAIAADAVIAGTIAAGAIRAVDAAFELAAIQDADINTLTASKLTAGTIDAAIVNVTNLNASNITVGTMSGVRLADGTVGDVKIASGLSASKITVGTMSGTLLADGTIADIKIASGLSASKITVGTLNAAVVSVTNLNASNITVGTMSGTRLQDGTVADVKIASLTASKLTAGTINAAVIAVTNLNASNITTGSMSGTRLADGTVADIKISGIAASKITAGTISASISITSPTINGGTINSATISAAASISASGDISSSAGWLVSYYGLQCPATGVLQIAGAQVVGTRKSAVSSPSADVGSLKTAVDALINRLQSHGLIS